MGFQSFMPQKTPLLFRFPSVHPKWMCVIPTRARAKRPSPARAALAGNHRKSPHRNSTRPAMWGVWWAHPLCTRSDATSSTRTYVQVRSTRPGRVPDSQRPLARHSREGSPPSLLFPPLPFPLGLGLRLRAAIPPVPLP